MTFSDIGFIIQWWFFLFLIGGIFFPLAKKIFPGFIDYGYPLAKILGIAVISYIIFITGLLHILPFTRLSVFFSLLLIICAYILIVLFKKHAWQTELGHFLHTLKHIWPLLIAEELLFLAGIFFWGYIRSFSPDVHGLEKFMDFGFMNSVLRAEYFPPKDMWLTPFSVNYYYFGHLASAVLMKLSNIPSNISYNLMLATIFSLCLTASFSIAATLASFIIEKTKRIHMIKITAASLLTAGLVTLAGNLHVVYTLFKPYQNEKPVPFWELAFSPSSFPNSYWYPNATRFIYNTIHEFPIYSWVVADLHGHVLDIPFVLLTIAVLLSVFLRFQTQNLHQEKSSENSEYSASQQTRNIRQSDNLKHRHSGIPSFPSVLKQTSLGYYLILISFLLAVLYMTNAWDGIIYLLLTALLFFSLALHNDSNQKYLTRIFSASIQTLPIVIAICIGFILFSLPFSLNFKPFVSGIGVLCAPKFLTDIGHFGPLLFEASHCQKSPLWQLAILHGFFFFFVISFLVFLSRTKKVLNPDLFILLLISLATFLIIVPEFIYAKDIYPAHYRANTMFKLVFQSFIMLSIATGYIIIRILSSFNYQEFGRKKKLLATCYVLLTTTLLTLVFIYPHLATKSYYGELKTYHGLDGTAYLKEQYPDDHEAINWLNKNIKNQPVILEAQGDSYTDYARISANTGLPTVLGWTVHEWLWRGKYDGGEDAPAPRIAEVQKMYESEDITETKNLLEKYNVEYVYIGSLEKQKYPSLNEEKFKELGKIIYQKGKTMIYQIL